MSKSSPPPAHRNGHDLDTAITTLRERFSGLLLQEGDSDYDRARQIWNAMFDRRPALIAQCQGTADVIEAVNFARQNDLLTAVHAGGHNSGGSGSCDGGIMIDLSGMNGVRVDGAARTARVEGGATWGDFDREAQVHGLATPGGLISATGVAGLTLSGGIGWLRGKHGLSLDNLTGVEIVTADGTLLTANENENSDLFWGVRGGGGNFGVVTSFEFRLHRVSPEVFFLAPVYRLEDAPQVIRRWRDFMAGAPDEIGGSMVEFSTIPRDPDYPEEMWGEKVLGVSGVWAGNSSDGERELAPLRNLAEPLFDETGIMPYCEVQQLFDGLFPKGVHRAYYKSLYLDGLVDRTINAVAEWASQAPSDLTLCSVWYMGAATGRPAPDATAFGARDMDYMLSIDSLWLDAVDDETNIGWSRAFWAEMKERCGGRAYLNFTGLGEEGEELVRASHGHTNYERLRALKAKYDPYNLFRLNQNIKPAGDSR